MKNSAYFKGKRVVIVGLARSGSSCANLLHRLGAGVFVTDASDNEATRANAARLVSRDIKFELGRHSRQFIEAGDLVVVSPGVPDSALPIVWAKELNIPVISEIEVGWLLCPATVIAVTGTNGKTTVTTLIGKVLEAAGKRVFTCGNIGNPFCAEVEKMEDGDFVSLEISSFQLEHIETFKPKIAAILNLSRNHLDRYGGMLQYLEAKKRIFINQDNDDCLVLNADDPEIEPLAKDAKSGVVYFRGAGGLNPNQAAVISVASVLGIKNDLVMRVLSEFKGVEHRLEEAACINGIKFINDSKATTVDATIWALNNMPEPVILIAGGREKGNDYSLILELAHKKVKEAILIGEAREKIKKAFSGKIPFSEASSLGEAVNKAFEKASCGDCVLFSPMCKSFDMFIDYEDRGRVFKKAVWDLKYGQKCQA